MSIYVYIVYVTLMNLSLRGVRTVFCVWCSLAYIFLCIDILYITTYFVICLFSIQRLPSYINPLNLYSHSAYYANMLAIQCYTSSYIKITPDNKYTNMWLTFYIHHQMSLIYVCPVVLYILKFIEQKRQNITNKRTK